MIFIISVIITVIIWKKVIIPIAKSMSKTMFDDDSDSNSKIDMFTNWWFDSFSMLEGA